MLFEGGFVSLLMAHEAAFEGYWSKANLLFHYIMVIVLFFDKFFFYTLYDFFQYGFKFEKFMWESFLYSIYKWDKFI